VLFRSVKPEGLRSLGEVWSALESEGAKLAKLRTISLNVEDSIALFGTRDFSGIMLTAIELVGPEVNDIWARVGGGARGYFSARGAAEAEKWLNGLFGASRVPSAGPSTAQCADCAVGIVWPHIVTKGLGGQVLTELLSCGLQITALELLDIDLVASEEFLEVYKNVVPEFVDMARELSSGPFLAVELSGDSAVERFREICGPRDVDVAKRIRPDTLRAKFGLDIVRNGIHCTDLVEDGPLESDFMFVAMAEGV